MVSSISEAIRLHPSASITRIRCYGSRASSPPLSPVSPSSPCKAVFCVAAPIIQFWGGCVNNTEWAWTKARRHVILPALRSRLGGSLSHTPSDLPGRAALSAVPRRGEEGGGLTRRYKWQPFR